VAAAHGVERLGYVATNGVMSESKAAWLARRFDWVGLSCDGPADIQDAHRPRWDGRPTAVPVERTARMLNAAGKRPYVRATITRLNVRRQVEMVEYFCDRLRPQEIHFEPVYRGGRAGLAAGLGPLEAADFVAHFLQARRKARAYRVPLLFTGCRLDTVHGPYCNVFRDVLNLLPGGAATACFKHCTLEQARARGMVVGALDESSGRFVIDQQRVQDLRRQLDHTPPGCGECFNRFHCVGECPDTCPAEDRAPETTWRCQVQKAIAAATLLEVADGLWFSSARQGENGKVYGTPIL